MASIKVAENEKVRESKSKGLRLETDVIKLLSSYRDFLIKRQGADPKKFPEARIVNDLLRQVFEEDAEFQKWLAPSVSSRAKKSNGAVLTKGASDENGVDVLGLQDSGRGGASGDGGPGSGVSDKSPA
jgi:hypothetical protein